MISINLDSPIPLAEQVRAGVRHAIAHGSVTPGQSLPTVRQLAADLGVNMNTVARAYRLLEADGLVRTVRGRGTLVRSAREDPDVAERSLRERIGRSIRELVSDARLAGLTRNELESMLREETRVVWSKE
ncbi:MAG TPA: GntR family transcriptional regulator [Vicinamibacteria bacterium]|nr:GntR family transcriptional regulator [Vicinamibacteria bacterium]